MSDASPPRPPSVSEAPTPLLDADGIGVVFGRNQVLGSAGLRAWPGRITAILGRNGAGKTTLFRVVCGRVRPRWGRVMWDGEVVERPSLARLSVGGLMYSAQESSLSPLFTLRDHFAVFAKRWGGADRIDEVVDRMHLSTWLDLKVTAMSGGEKQRASLALALLRRPRCLLADEPFAGVSPRDRPGIADALRSLAGDGCAVVLSGHDVNDIFEVSHEILWMTAGTTHHLGSPEEAREHFGFRREYLGPRG